MRNKLLKNACPVIYAPGLVLSKPEGGLTLIPLGKRNYKNCDLIVTSHRLRCRANLDREKLKKMA